VRSFHDEDLIDSLGVDSVESSDVCELQPGIEAVDSPAAAAALNITKSRRLNFFLDIEYNY